MFLAIAKSLFRRKTVEVEAEVVLEELTDEALMVRYAEQADAQAFELLLKRHERGVFHFILRSVGRRELAEELVQETFLRVIRSASKYEERAKFSTWVYTIARNLCIDRSRKKSGKDSLTLDRPIGDDPQGGTFVDRVVDPRSSVGTSYDRSAFRQRLAAALEELPEAQREVFVMRQVSGMRFREIAEVLEVSEPTVKSRMRYALEFLRGRLSMYEGHSFDGEDDEANEVGP